MSLNLMANDDDNDLEITFEKDRVNKYISTVLYSRAVMFHPSDRLNGQMKKNLLDVAKSGGSRFEIPLASKTIKSKNSNTYKIELFGDYLLQTHRELLETILAFADLIKLKDQSYFDGKSLTWDQIFKYLPNFEISKDREGISKSNKIHPDSFILSISLYDLAKYQGRDKTRKNYDSYENMILQLSLAQLVITEYSEDGRVIEKSPLTFFEDYKFVFDRSKIKNKKGLEEKNANHLFIIPALSLCDAIDNKGYLKKEFQMKIAKYSVSSLQTFFKWFITHSPKFIHTKKLDWMIDFFYDSLATPVHDKFKRDLKKKFLANLKQFEADFDFTLIPLENGDFQFYNKNLDRKIW